MLNVNKQLHFLVVFAHFIGHSGPVFSGNCHRFNVGVNNPIAIYLITPDDDPFVS